MKNRRVIIMKKKTVSMLLLCSSLTMALSLFAGCGSSKDTATEDTSKTESTETTDEYRGCFRRKQRMRAAEQPSP